MIKYLTPLLFLSLPVFAQETSVKTPEVVHEEVMEESSSYSFWEDTSIIIGLSPQRGGVYYGGRKSNVDFLTLSLAGDYTFKNNVKVGVEFNLLRNKSVFQAEQLLITGGYEIPLPKNFSILAKAKLGVGFMREANNVYKSESYSGRVIGLELAGKYALPFNLSLGAGINWLHQMHAPSFNGSEPNDVVIDQFGPKLFLEYNF